MPYKPDPVSGVADIPSLTAYLLRELQKVSNAFGQVLPSQIPVYNAEPPKPRDYMLVAADGINWNPGGGKGLYYYFQGSWIFVGTAVTPPPPTQTPVVPAVSSFSPTSGPSGTVVNIQGSGFTGTTAVAFGGTPATQFTVVGDTQINATVPVNAVTGIITVTNAAGTGGSAQQFTVEAATTGGGATNNGTYNPTGFYDFSDFEDYSQIGLSGKPWIPQCFNENVDFKQRVFIVNTPFRSGSHAVKLLTSGNDVQIHGSGTTGERCDLHGGESNFSSGWVQGSEVWVATSYFLPDEFDPATGVDFYDFIDFHGDLGIPVTLNWTFSGLQIIVRAGGSGNGNEQTRIFPYGQNYRYEKNIWYDWVFHVRFDAGNGGIVQVWARKGSDVAAGAKVLDYTGPSLTAGDRIYMKLANYHGPNTGNPSVVIHDRYAAGPTLQSVQWFPLVGIDA